MSFAWFLGLGSSLALGAFVGFWFAGLADWLRCRSEGLEDARERRACARADADAWNRLPWERLAAGHPDRAFVGVAALIGAFVWAAAWFVFWRDAAGLLAWAWDVAFLSALLLLSLLDARWRVLPVEPMAVGAVLFGIGRWVLGTPLVDVLLGAGVCLLFFGAQAWLSRGRWLGGGDPVLAVMIGAALGWPRAPVGIYATYLAVLPLVFVQFYRTRTLRRVRWPFGPLLAFGALVAWFDGAALWRWLVGG